jgi:hypothetical protein
MTLAEEVKSRVAYIRPGKRVQFKALPKGNEAWLELDPAGRRIAAWFAVPADAKIFRDDFSSIHLRMDKDLFNGAMIKTLRLEGWDYEGGKNVFASICENFLLPENRETLCTDPGNWTDEWKKQLGNAVKRRSPSDVIAEMLVLLELRKLGFEPEWAGPRKGSHDIICSKFEVEVKSSTVRGTKLIRISSQNQAQQGSGLPLYIAYVGFEKSPLGRHTISSVVEDLTKAGFPASSIENGLDMCGYPTGKPERIREKFNRLEQVTQFYAVDKKFPKITPESFVQKAIPLGITKIEYTVDLAANVLTRLDGAKLIKLHSKRSKKNR